MTQDKPKINMTKPCMAADRQHLKCDGVDCGCDCHVVHTVEVKVR